MGVVMQHGATLDRVAEHALMTVEEVADRMRVSTETVRRWLRTGLLRGIRANPAGAGGWRIERTELERFLESRRPDH